MISDLYSKKDKHRSVWVRLSEAEFEKIKEIASSDGLSLGVFTRKYFLKTIEERRFKKYELPEGAKQRTLAEILGPKKIEEEAKDDKACSNDQGVLEQDRGVQETA